MPFPKNPTGASDVEAAPEMEAAQLVERIAGELDLLSRNVDILERLAGNTPMGIIRLSEAMHLPIHKVRYSLHLLEREGVIQPSADGAVVTEKAKEFWDSLDKSLDQMTGLIRHLQERAAENRKRPGGSGGRKG
ncbi:MAG: hypothetical protein L3K03_08570 [Thermoplasmata archaeon]|nr:hypothetical protein [Thermoplasmata archaeon]